MRLAITPTRMHLLRDIAAGYIVRVDGTDISLRTGQRVTAAVHDLSVAGWAALGPAGPACAEVSHWQLTPLGRGYQSVWICDYGTHVVAGHGPETQPTVIGEMRPLSGLPGRHRITIGDTTLVVTGRPAAVAELRHQAAQAQATADTATCARCQIEPARGECCTSHGRQLCHLCYRRTHWVEVCVEGCQDCTAEGLPVRLPQRPTAQTAGQASAPTTGDIA